MKRIVPITMIDRKSNSNCPGKANTNTSTHTNANTHINADLIRNIMRISP